MGDDNSTSEAVVGDSCDTRAKNLNAESQEGNKRRRICGGMAAADTRPSSLSVTGALPLDLPQLAEFAYRHV